MLAVALILGTAAARSIERVADGTLKLGDTQVLAAFKDGRGADGASFAVTNDPVMGGQSNSSLRIVYDDAVNADVGFWSGEVKIVPKLQAPGFCRLDADFSKKDVSNQKGLLYTFASFEDNDVSGNLMAVVAGRGLFGGFQFTAPLQLAHTGSGQQGTAAFFVPFSAFKPFGIRPEPGKAPTPLQLKDVTEVGILADGHKGDIKIGLISIAAANSGPAPGPAPSPDSGTDLFRFGAEGVQPWKVTNDPVMGGRSKSTFTVGTDGAGNKNVGLFDGDVAIVPSLKAPGFCNAYVEIPAVDASAYDGIEITMRSHGPLQAYKSSWAGKFVPKDPNCHHPGCQYQQGTFKAGFNITQTSASAEMQKIVIPWTEYTYRWSDFTGGCTDHGAVCCSAAHPEVCPDAKSLSSITQIGIWGEGTAGDFALDIFSVRAVKIH